MEEFGGLESKEETIAILGDRGCSQMVERDWDRINKHLLCTNSVRTNRKERPNVGGDAVRNTNVVVHLERDAWSSVKRLKKAANEYALPRV